MYNTLNNNSSTHNYLKHSLCKFNVKFLLSYGYLKFLKIAFLKNYICILVLLQD